MTEYCDLDPHVRLSEAAEYTGIKEKTIQKYLSVERIIQPCEPPEKEGGWFLFEKKDFTRLLIVKKLVEDGMPISDVRIFMGWLDDTRVRLLRHTKRQQGQDSAKKPMPQLSNFETEFGCIYEWQGGEPPPWDDSDADGRGPDSNEPKSGNTDQRSSWQTLNYDPFPPQASTSEFYEYEPEYPKPPVEASGWLEYWKSVRQIVHVDQYRLREECPEYPVYQLLLPVRSLESVSRAANYTRRWGFRTLGEITLEIMKYKTSFAVSNVRFLNLALIKAEVAERILNPPETIRQHQRGSS